LWDAAALDTAGQDGEVAPTFINLADASIKMVGQLYNTGVVPTNKVADRNATDKEPQCSTLTKCAFDIHCWQKSIPITFQFPTFAHTMDSWDSTSHV